MNEKPLKSENYLKSEEFLSCIPDPKLREFSNAPWPNDMGLVVEEYEDRIDYVYVIRHLRFRKDDPSEERYVLSSEPKEEIRNKTSQQKVKDMENRIRLIKQIERYRL